MYFLNGKGVSTGQRVGEGWEEAVSAELSTAGTKSKIYLGGLAVLFQKNQQGIHVRRADSTDATGLANGQGLDLV